MGNILINLSEFAFFPFACNTMGSGLSVYALLPQSTPMSLNDYSLLKGRRSTINCFCCASVSNASTLFLRGVTCLVMVRIEASWCASVWGGGAWVLVCLHARTSVFIQPVFRSLATHLILLLCLGGEEVKRREET